METKPTTGLTGLTSQEAANRLRQFGPNGVHYERHTSALVQFLLTFNNPLTLLLIAVAIISGFLGAKVDTVIILVVVAISVSLDFFNSYRSGQAAQALEQRVRTTAIAIRDGRETELPLEQLVVGDVIKLTPGKIIPADAKVAATNDLYIDESSLTGEAFPQPKPLAAAIYMGSSVVSGSGFATITATGQNTRFSRLAATLTGSNQTDFDRGIKAFSSLILRLVMVLALFVFIVNSVLKGDLLESLLFAVALAVGMTPELLPMIITLNLTRGALGMSQHGVIVKKLASIQNFGSMDILCTDKTGTLTENHIALIKAVDSQGRESEDVLRFGYLHSVYEMGVDNPLDEAVKHHGAMDITGYQKLDEYPFDYVRKCSSILIGHGSSRFLVTKGAAEEVIAKCTHVGTGLAIMTSHQREAIHRQYQQLSADGFRVLALATQPHVKAHQPIKQQEDHLAFVGFLAFLDPAKAGVEATLRLIEEHGIAIKILTGDNELVSRRIADEIHLPIQGVLTGPEIDHLSVEQFAKAVETTTIFARLTPEQKLRTIKALRANGHVVGYMGDGINDAPSLKTADVGISVNNAVDVAKETADIILLKHSLHQLINGVIEGRKTFINTSKYLMMVISSNFGNMLSMAAASVFLPWLPMLPTQVLLNNLIYDTSQLAIPFDSVDTFETKAPRKWDLAFLKRAMIIFGPLSSLYDILTFGVLIWILHLTEAGFQTGWFLESIITQILVVFVIRTRRPRLLKSKPSYILVSSAAFAVILSLAVTILPIGSYFGFVAPTYFQTLLIMGIVAAYLLSVNLVRLRLFRLGGQPLALAKPLSDQAN